MVEPKEFSPETFSEESLHLMTQSPYFYPSLNTAIYDGPLRIFFSQMQEGVALHLYSKLVNRIENPTEETPTEEIFDDKQEFAKTAELVPFEAQEVGRNSHAQQPVRYTSFLDLSSRIVKRKNLFILLYPSQETFDQYFLGSSTSAGLIQHRFLGENLVIGLRGPLPDDVLEDLCYEVEIFFRGLV